MAHSISPSAFTPAVAHLLERTAREYGVAPISDGLIEAAKHPDDATISLAVTVDTDTDNEVDARAEHSDKRVIGFAVAAPQGERGAAELVIDSAHRGKGLGRELWEALKEKLAGTSALDSTWPWSHGDHPAAAHMAETDGYTRARELLQIHTGRIDTADFKGFPTPTLPERTFIRTFRPGDEVQWRRVNNAAFDWHPEQGRQSAEAYAELIKSPDFKPEDVFFAVRDEQILGFHHTKMHIHHPSGLRVGEVYVIGVDPAAQAHGVGRALMHAGMEHLYVQGAQQIELYVESDNHTALNLYRALGFDNEIAHVSYRPGGAPAES